MTPSPLQYHYEHRAEVEVIVQGKTLINLRVAPSGGVIGWDMGAALSLASALGICTIAAAEFLPAIEAVMVRKINEQMKSK